MMAIYLQLMKLYSIYRITNEINGLSYIGRTVNVQRRFKRHVYDARPIDKGGSDCFLYRAMRKYGHANFRIETLETGLTNDESIEREIRCIADGNTRSPHGYNMTDGGDGTSNPTPETRAKWSAASRAYWAQPGTRQKMSELGKGRTHTEESRLLMSLRNKGRAITEAAKLKMRAAKLGRSHTPEHSKKISASQQRRLANPAARKKAADGQIKRYKNPEERRLSAERAAMSWQRRKEAQKAKENINDCEA
jgi:group I intron endonuclease